MKKIFDHRCIGYTISVSCLGIVVLAGCGGRDSDSVKNYANNAGLTKKINSCSPELSQRAYFDAATMVPVSSKTIHLVQDMRLGLPQYIVDCSDFYELFSTKSLGPDKADEVNQIISNKLLGLRIREVPNNTIRDYMIFMTWFNKVPRSKSEEFFLSWLNSEGFVGCKVWIYGYREKFQKDNLTPVAWLFFVHNDQVVFKSVISDWNPSIFSTTGKEILTNSIANSNRTEGKENGTGSNNDVSH